MILSGERLIPADRTAVWQALNDPDVLKRCIPGCEEFDRVSDHEMAATVRIKLGPVKARFKGAVELSNIDAPNGYTISGKGSGGIAGFARGGATVALLQTREGTRLTYEATAAVGGKLAQLGQRLIKSSSEKLATEFFDHFADHFEVQAEPLAP